MAGIAYSGTDSLTFNIAVRPDYLPTNGLMAWYPFNGNATDESGNGNNATIHGPSLTTDRENNVNSSFVFNGTDYLLVEGDESLESNELTISLWANASSLNSTNGLPAPWNTIIKKGDFTTVAGEIFYFASTVVKWQWCDSRGV